MLLTGFTLVFPVYLSTHTDYIYLGSGFYIFFRVFLLVVLKPVEDTTLIVVFCATTYSSNILGEKMAANNNL